MTFHVGQKVVCVSDRGLDNPKWMVYRGEIYTICEIFPEHVNITEQPPFAGGAFYSWRFRPVVERKTSIEIFQRMLTPKKEHVNA